MSFNCVSLKLAVTQTSRSGLARQRLPGRITWPALTTLFDTMPRAGALTVVYCRLRSAGVDSRGPASPAASADDARAGWRQSARPRSAPSASSACACCSPARDCATCSRSTRCRLRPRHLRARRIDAGCQRVPLPPRGSTAAARSRLSRAGRERSTSRAALAASLGLAQRAARDHLAARPRFFVRGGHAALCLRDAPRAVVTLLAAVGRRDRPLLCAATPCLPRRRAPRALSHGDLISRGSSSMRTVRPRRASLSPIADLRDRAGDARGDLRHPRIDLGIVGPLAPSRSEPTAIPRRAEDAAGSARCRRR